MFNLALLDEVLDDSGDVLDRHSRVNPMLVEQVDRIAAQALQGGLRDQLDMLGAAIHAASTFTRPGIDIEAEFGGEQRGSAPISALETVLSVPGVKDAAPDVQGYARIIGKDGKPIGADNGPPTFGGIASASVAGLWNIEEGRLPVGPTEMVMDKVF